MHIQYFEMYINRKLEFNININLSDTCKSVYGEVLCTEHVTRHIIRIQSTMWRTINPNLDLRRFSFSTV